MRFKKVNHPRLQNWVEEMTRLCQPDAVVWLNGSTEEKARLENIAVQEGALLSLNKKKWPGCFYHRSAANDVARVENLTFICSRKKENAGPTNNWMAPAKAYKKAGEFFKNSMKGRTMYVIPFCMGRPNSPFTKIGVQLTDSVYVALNMRIMTHIGAPAIKRLGRSGAFTKCLHSTADLDINKRLILHFPDDNTIWSVGSGYGGNALLGKKCMALRIASALARKEGWLAEHMLLMGIEDPRGRVTYVAASFPSACGKTNLAMIKPPKEFAKKGWKVRLIGDDISWLRIGADGALYAMNPEAGFFGVAPGTNSKTNPNAMASIRRNTIFTNVLLKPDNTVWWEDCDEPAPASGTNWQGLPWKPGMKDEEGKPVRGAHPNSRFTAPIEQCPIFSKDFFKPKGVKISAIIFGGRHARLSPLVYEAKNWTHGVFMGATVSSEITAAQTQNIGKVRRDPMAMLPFCGYHMGDYLAHWLNMGRKLKKPPRVFHVNWFRKDQDGKFMWPGFGENFRVLDWIIKRCRNEVKAGVHPLGGVPSMNDLNLRGLNVTAEEWARLFDVDSNLWKDDLEDQKRFFKKLGKKLPPALEKERKSLAKRLRV